MKIEKAKPSDYKILTELTFRSKAFWGYTQQQMGLWTEELSLDPEFIKNNRVYQLIDQDSIIGYYAYIEISALKLELDKFFIDPPFIGQGYGSRLINDFFQKVKNPQTVRVYSDPFAEAFYAKHGFKVVGQEPTKIVGRYLPIMEKGGLKS